MNSLTIGLSSRLNTTEGLTMRTDQQEEETGQRKEERGIYESPARPERDHFEQSTQHTVNLSHTRRCLVYATRSRRALPHHPFLLPRCPRLSQSTPARFPDCTSATTTSAPARCTRCASTIPSRSPFPSPTATDASPCTRVHFPRCASATTTCHPHLQSPTTSPAQELPSTS